MAASIPAGTFIGTFGYKKSAYLGATVLMLSFLLAGSTGFYSLPMKFNATSLPSTRSSLPPLPSNVFIAQVVYCVAAVFIGVGFAFYYVGQHTLISSSVASSSRGRAFSFVGGFWRISGILFPLIAGGLASTVGLRAALLLFAMVPVTAGLLAALCWPLPMQSPPLPLPIFSSSSSTAATTTTTTTKMLQQQTARKASCCKILIDFKKELFQVGTFTAFLAIVRHGRHILIPLVGIAMNFDVLSISLALTTTFVCAVSIFPMSGYIMDKWGRRVNGSMSVTILGTGLAVLGLSTNFEVYIASCVLMGFGNGLSSGLIMTLGGDLASNAEEERRGPFLGVYKLVGDVGGLAGPLIAGVIASAFDTSVSCFVFVGFACLGLTWLVLVMPETRPKTATEEMPIDKNHHVVVQASPAEMPSLLVQPELISTEYKEQQHDISRINTVRLLQHWLRIYSYLQPSFPQRIGMRRLCRLFDAVERLTTENYSRHSKLMLMPIPSGVWTTFPHASHNTLVGLVEWVNGVVEESPGNAPQLLFLQEGAPAEEDGEDGYDSLSGACVVVDETGCFRLTGDNVTDDDVVRVGREYSNLQLLNLDSCRRITDASLREVARQCLNLQSLNLARCYEITDASLLEVARGCANLQLLHLERCYITDASVLEVARGCANLQLLNLEHCYITDASVLEVARWCSNLQTLRLTHCCNITDASVSEVARGCSNLLSLNLAWCAEITDASLLEVARRCSNLKSLDLAGCENITDASLSEVARGCPNLEALNLYDCRNITDASMLEVARDCSNLQSLCLISCENITDASLSEVARGCSNLQSLDLTSCENITDASVSEVARRCSHLHSFMPPDSITDAGLLEVARRCANLKSLDLRYCENITSVCENALRQSHPQLDLQVAD